MEQETSSKTSVVYLEFDEPRQVATLWLNRPEKVNALNWAMFSRIQEILDQLSHESGLRALVIRSTCDHFSAGIDIGFLGGQDPTAPTSLGLDDKGFRYMMRHVMQPIFTRLTSLEVVTIAFIDGICFGSGFELALACDFRFATPRSVFQMKESWLGLIPDLGGIARLSRLVNESTLKEICLVGRKYSAEEAVRLGFVNHMRMGMENLEACLAEFMGDLLNAAPLPVGLGKRAISWIYNKTEEEALNYEALIQSTLIRSQDFHEAVKAFMEKRKPHFIGK